MSDALQHLHARGFHRMRAEAGGFVAERWGLTIYFRDPLHALQWVDSPEGRRMARRMARRLRRARRVC